MRQLELLARLELPASDPIKVGSFVFCVLRRAWLRQEKGGSEFLIRRKGPADAQGECGEDQMAGYLKNVGSLNSFRIFST